MKAKTINKFDHMTLRELQELVDAFEAFIQTFERVFGWDWNYTREKLPMVCEGMNLLESPVDHWGSFEMLIKRFNALRAKVDL